MIGLDTNVIVRFFVDDDPAQAAQARSLFSDLSADNQAYVTMIVLAELYWVLRSRYRIARSVVLETMENLLSVAHILVQRRDLVERALEIARHSRAEFTDILIALQNTEAGCAVTKTFDRSAAKLVQMQLLK